MAGITAAHAPPSVAKPQAIVSGPSAKPAQSAGPSADVRGNLLPSQPSAIPSRSEAEGFNPWERPQSGSSPRIQRKLVIGAASDPMEDEAERMARQVLRVPRLPAVGSAQFDPERNGGFSGGISKHHDESLGHGQQGLEGKPAPAGLPGRAIAPPFVDQVVRSPGVPLDAATRAFMEPRFGRDFSQVRVHSDEMAEQSARQISARAYTVGHNIVFARDQFAPSTRAGRRLLAHELTHVVQQAGIPSPDAQAAVGMVQRDSGSDSGPDTDDPWSKLNEVDREIAQDQLNTTTAYANFLARAQQGHMSAQRGDWITALHVAAAKIAAVDRGSKLLDIEGEIPALTAEIDRSVAKSSKEWTSIERRYVDEHRWLLSRDVKSVDSVEAAKYLEEIYNRTKPATISYPTEEDYLELKIALEQGRDFQIGALRGARIRFKQLREMMDVVADLMRDGRDPEKFIPNWKRRVGEEAAHLASLAASSKQASAAAADPEVKERNRGIGAEVSTMRDDLLARQQETLKTKARPGKSWVEKGYDLVHGAASAVAGIFIEAGKEAVDLIQINIHFVTLGKYTPHFISDMAAAAEQGASTGDLLKGMITNMIETPSRFLKACEDGDWDAIGRETLNLYLLADTLKGVPEAVKKFPETLDKVRELGEKVPELIAKTHESLRILRARSVALALKNEGRLLMEQPKPAALRPPPAAAPRAEAPVHLKAPPHPAGTPAPAPVPAAPVRAVPNPPDMVRTPATPPKGNLVSIGPDGTPGPVRGSGRQPTPPSGPTPPGSTPAAKGAPRAANDNAVAQRVRATGTTGRTAPDPVTPPAKTPARPGDREAGGGGGQPIRASGGKPPAGGGSGDSSGGSSGRSSEGSGGGRTADVPRSGGAGSGKSSGGGGGAPPYEGPTLRKLKPGEAPPPGVTPLTRQQAHMIEVLRSGHDVTVPDLRTARALLENMPDVRPHTGTGNYPWETAPSGTSRGDLVNIWEPDAPHVHAPGTAPEPHQQNPHYNIEFPDGTKAAILIAPK